VLLPLLVLLLAVAVFAVAFYYVGGIDYLTALMAGSGAGSGGPQASPAPAVVATATPVPTGTPDPAPAASALILPPGVTPSLAKRMYVEQIQSQVNLNKMADGEIVYFTVTSLQIAKTRDKATIFIKAFFSDGTAAPGVIQLVKPDGTWYFMSITGLRSDKIGGSAETVQHGTIAEGEQANEEVIRQSGVTHFDYGVINAMLAEQVECQSIILDMINGRVDRIDLQAPKAGAGTTTVPAKLSGKAPTKVDGDAVLIRKNVDYEDLLFLAAFRTN
jgi:hypothetical protein